MPDNKSVDRLFVLLSYVAFCGDFPKNLAARIGGHPDWNRHVMYHAVEEGYLVVWRGKISKRIVNSLRITEKGLEYIGEKDLAVFGMIAAQRDSRNPGTHTGVEKVVRLHSLATTLVMAQNAGAMVMTRDKPPLLLGEMRGSRKKVDPEQTYYYSIQELRAAIAEKCPRLKLKGSRMTGILVKGYESFHIYNTGSSRMFWMRSTEENFSAAVDSLLNARGFQVRVIKQIILGNKMSVARKINKRSDRHTDRYFVLSRFYNNCYFVPNSAEGEIQLRTMIDRDLAKEVNRRALQGCEIPQKQVRDYDAIDLNEGRPVILNYMFDMLLMRNADLLGEETRKTPILLCFDHQVEEMQRMAGAKVEVRGIGEVHEYG